MATSNVDDEIRRLHSKGLGDREIGARVGLGVTGVFRRRAKLGLAANNPRPRRGWDADEAKRLHGIGLNDCEVAQVLRVSRETIQKWRVGAGLAPNGWSIKSARRRPFA